MLARYLHTLMHLKPRQVTGRLKFRLSRPAVDRAPAPPRRSTKRAWIAGALRQASQTSGHTFSFLNVKHELHEPSDWNNPAWPKLWLYNLHYFDDLNAAGAARRSEWHQPLIRQWVRDNPPPAGNGWEPYPLSLRIVNWIKWCLAGNVLPPEAIHSLAIQCRYLAQRLEFHLLGNHLLKNAKALVFAGLFFEGPEPDEWLSTGLEILAEEIPEQILPDGGHFERSPMYHAIILEDLLDLINIGRTCSEAEPRVRDELLDAWRAKASQMLAWMAATAHPDGEISLFNDAAFGIACAPGELRAYALRLGVEGTDPTGGLVHLAASGYVRLAQGPAVAVLDVGAVGPDYLPGHAHADTLSFELSVRGRRLVVDSGTSCYEAGAERLRQRSTAAHNTVEIDGVSSSDVWGSFRVAQRAYPRDLCIRRSGDSIEVECAHDGYRRLRGRPIHRRRWVMQPGRLTVLDVVEGGFGKAVARMHFHPACVVERDDADAGSVSLGGVRILRWSVAHGAARILESTYHPEFGLSLPSRNLEVELVSARAEVTLEWDR